MLPTLHVHLLGDFRLVYGELPVTSIDSPRLQSLLAYLLLHRDAPQPRQRLAFLFYSDSTEAQARANLRSLLHLLRKTLPDADRFVAADAQTLQWRTDSRFSLDVSDFEEAVQQATSVPALEKALELYRGELLPTCYDDWILTERARLHQTYIEALERLLRLFEQEHDYRSAILYAEQLLRHDPLREESYVRLMRLYALNGDRASVQRIYQECVTILKRELDVEPSATTRQAYAQAIRLEAPSANILLPAPRTNNLAVPLTSFIGRKREMTEVKQLLDRTRLLTLTGAGGSGKTRLAIQVATDLISSFKDGVWWVELVALTDPTLVPQATAKALGVREVPSQPLSETLAHYLYSKHPLLVFDNCEHLIDACAQLAAYLLQMCSNLKIMTTSREALGITGESIFQVPTLSLPDTLHLPVHQVLEYEGTRLFVERALAVKSDFALNEPNASFVIQICRRLDGIPLAIELAAARTRMLKVETIAARLDDRFNLLTLGERTALPRQQTLRATIDWSYDLLPEVARLLFRRLAVFVGGFTLDAAEQVCSDEKLARRALLDLLARLVDRSLVVVDHSREAERYRLLETIREYAHEKLTEAGEADTVRDRHLEFFHNLAAEAEPRLLGAQVTWFNRLDVEMDNLRAAIEWSLQNEGAPEGQSAVDRTQAGLRLVAASVQFLEARYRREASELLKRLLASEGAKYSTSARARALNAAGYLQSLLGNFAEARLLLEESLRIGRELGDKVISAWALVRLGAAFIFEGDYGRAQSCLEEGMGLSRELGSEGKNIRGFGFSFLGDVYLGRGDEPRAQQVFEEGAILLRELQSKNPLAYILRRLGYMALHHGSLSKAEGLFKESLTLNQEIGHLTGSAACLAALAATRAARAQAVDAVKLSGAVAALLSTTESTLWAIDRSEQDRNVAAQRAQLGDAAFEAAWTDGQAMTLEQAIEYALGGTAQEN